MGAYSQKEIARIKRVIRRKYGATRVCHIYPRVYCVAKPAPLCAVVVSPWPDAEIQIRDPRYSSSHTIQHRSAGIAEAGGWYSMAYAVFGSSMEHVLIDI